MSDFISRLVVIVVRGLEICRCVVMVVYVIMMLRVSSILVIKLLICFRVRKFSYLRNLFSSRFFFVFCRKKCNMLLVFSFGL